MNANSNVKAGKTANSASSASVNSVNSKVFNETYRQLSKDAKQTAKGFSFQCKAFLVLIAPTNVWWKKSLNCKFEKNEKIDSKIAKCLELAKQNANFVDKDHNICSIKYLYHESETYPNGQKVKTGFKYIIKPSFTLASILQLLYKPAKVQLIVETDKDYLFEVKDATVTIEEVKVDKTKKAPATKATK